MNENVTNKTPKRRRWIARLLVSALCILLASSLLFVTVVAENVNVIQVSIIDQSTSDVKSKYYYHYGADGYVGVTEISSNPSGLYFYAIGWNESYTLSSPLIVLPSTLGKVVSFGSTLEHFWIVYFSSTSGSSSLRFLAYEWNGSLVYDHSDTGYNSSAFRFGYVSSYYDSDVNFYCLGTTFSASTGVTKFYIDGSYVTKSYLTDFIFWDSGRESYLAIPYNSNSNFPFDLYTSQFLTSFLGSTGSYRIANGISFLSSISSVFYFSSIQNGVLVSVPASVSYDYSLIGVSFYDLSLASYSEDSFVGYAWKNNDADLGDGIYQIFVSSSEYVPPESSDETMESPPPESSDESSEEPVEGGTKVYSVVNSLKHEPTSFVTTEVGSIDTNNAVSIQAYLGNFMDSSLEEWDDSPHRLSIRVLYEDGTENVYNFDFNAYGFYSSATPPTSIIEGFSYPSYVGKWFDIPYELGDSLYFSFSSQGGHFLVYNSTFQCTVNLATFDSYARIDFVDAENFSIVVFNDDPVGDRLSFDQGVIRYKKFYTDELGGSSSASNWYYPEEGTSIRIDGLQSGSVIPLTSIRIETNLDYTGMRDESKYEDYMSRVDDDLNDFSINQELINSLANGNFGQADFSGDMSNEFIDAIGRFDNIVNSSGGSTIFGFFGYMWSVHPLASTMVAIVASLAVIGFVVRKV